MRIVHHLLKDYANRLQRVGLYEGAYVQHNGHSSRGAFVVLIAIYRLLKEGRPRVCEPFL